MLLGAIAQSLPDIDVVSAFWWDPARNLLAHRGFTHSLLFVVLITPLLALASKRWNRNSSMTYRDWLVFFATQLSVHIFMDSFNAYGTGWFEPFSHVRMSFNVLFVADPLFTVWLIVSTIALTRVAGQQRRLRWTLFGLIMSGLYLLFAITNKTIVDREVRKSLQEQSISYNRYFSTPTPFNSLLWFVVAADEKGYHIGYRSVFDKRPVIDFQYFPKNDSLLYPLRQREDVQNLLRFSKGYFTVSHLGDTLIFNDLRFGQSEGWNNPKDGFVFHYYLQRPDQNRLVIQRGRFSRWDREIASLWRRMWGD